MKKILLTSLICATALSLVACSGRTRNANTNGSSTTGSTTRASSSASSANSSISSTDSSSSKDNQKKQEETRQKYQEIITRGSIIVSEGAKGRDAVSSAVDAQLPLDVANISKNATENQMWKSSYSLSQGNLQYAFYDIDQDGVDEMLIGTPQEVNGIFSLHDDKPELQLTGMNASAGGIRTKIFVLQDGTIVYSVNYSNEPDITAMIYKLSNGTAQQQGEQYSIYQEDTAQAAIASLGLTTPTLDLTSLSWENFPAASSSSAEQSPSSTTAMDINAIANGDFSSVAGTWKDGKGKTLVFDRNGLSGHQSVGSISGLSIRGNYLFGSFESAPGPDGIVAGGGYAIMVPANVTLVSDLGQDDSDQSRDRMVLGNGFISADAFFYKVD